MSDATNAPVAPAAPAAPAAPDANTTPVVAAPAAPEADASISIDDAPVAETPDAGAEDAPAEYESTGDVGLDIALEFIGARGIKPSDPAMIAAEKGDFSLLEAKLAAMGDKAKGYKQMLALGQKAFNDVKAAADAKAAASATAIHELVGGKEQWLAIKTWAAKEAEPAEKSAINAALSQGGLVAKMVAQGLAERFNRAAGNTVEPASVTQANANGKPAGPTPLTRQGFIQEADALRNKMGARFEGSKEYAALRARRSASARAGH